MIRTPSGTKTEDQAVRRSSTELTDEGPRGGRGRAVLSTGMPTWCIAGGGVTHLRISSYLVHSVVCTPISSLRKAKTCFAPPPAPPGESGPNSAIPARTSGPGPEGPGTARFTKPLEMKKRRSARCSRVAALVQLHPPKPPPRPTGGSHCLGYHLGRTGG
jgi:hypothetical protein